MNKVKDFIDQLDGQHREIMRYFHNLLSKELELTEKIRFKIPFYYGKSWICLPQSHKKRRCGICLCER